VKSAVASDDGGQRKIAARAVDIACRQLVVSLRVSVAEPTEGALASAAASAFQPRPRFSVRSFPREGRCSQFA